MGQKHRQTGSTGTRTVAAMAPSRRLVPALLAVPFAAASAVAVASVAAAAAPATVPAAPPAYVVTVTDPGDPATAIDLSPVAVVGAKTNETANFFLTATASDGSRRVDVSETATVTFTTEVVAAQPDGAFTQNYAVAAATSSNPIGESYTSVQYFAPLQGLLLTTSYDAAWNPTPFAAAPGVAPSEEQAQALELLAAAEGPTSVIVPDAAVGVGATWTLTTGTGTSMVTVQNWRLSSIAGGMYTIDYDLTFTYDRDQHETEPTTVVSGTRTGTGTYSGRVGHAVGDVWHKIEYVDDLVYDEAGYTADYDVTWSYERITTLA